MRALVLAIVVFAARAASADSVEDAAQVHLDRGIAAFDRHDYVAAHEDFAAANKLVPEKPNPYRWLALTEVQLGDCAHARPNIEAFLARVAADDVRRAEMLRLRALCDRNASLAVRPPPEKPRAAGGLDVHVEPERPTPITRRWWFVPAVVGAVAVAGAAVYLATRDSSSTSSLPGVICDASGCHAGGP